MISPSMLLAAGLETALNQYLRLDPDALPRVAALAGKVIALNLLLAPANGDVGLTLYLLPGPSGIRVLDSYAGAPDVLIRGTPFALANLSGSGTTLKLGTGVEIIGDTQLGKAFKELLDSIDIDWEEHLSQVVGDTVAHQVGNSLRHIRNWGHKVVDTLSRDISEYLQEEGRDLPPRKAIEAFLEAVDVLRSDIDRLEARIRRLQQAKTNKTKTSP